MSIQPTEHGGRVFQGDTPYGDYRVELDRDFDGDIFDHNRQRVGHAKLSISQPSAATSDQSRNGGCGGRAKAGDLPAARPGHVSIAPPGDWLTALLYVLTLGLLRPCTGCKSRAAAMNAAGWRGLPKLLITALWARIQQTIKPRSNPL